MNRISLCLFLILALSGCRKSEVDTISSVLRSEIISEVRQNVIPFWVNFSSAPDGGFYGTVMRNGMPVEDAARGGVLNSRILWSFASAYKTFGDNIYLSLANKAQRYFLNTFIDKKNGGVYWLVKPDGEVLNGAKYTYAMTYGIYGLAEHYLATGNEESLNVAIELYHTLETKGRDAVYEGYIESFTENWMQLEKYENNACKTMNAHLHVLEAYTLLYQCWKDNGLRKRLECCVNLFINKIYDSDRKHFNLFFDQKWNSLVEMDSYGHDVEAGWLLCAAADVLGDKVLEKKCDEIALDVTRTCMSEGVNHDFGYMAYEKKGDKIVPRCSWWGQAETLIACVNAWQISGDNEFIYTANRIWNYVKEAMIDHEYGEWFSDCFNGIPHKDSPKISMWRCPYHTVRLAIEMNNRF